MESFLIENKTLISFLAVVWMLPWKAYAVWLAVNRKEKIWFAIFMVVNFLAIIEIVYIFLVVKKTPAQAKKAFLDVFKKSGWQ
ncbi:MAG: DUF5652 family protein [Candidatus Pacebacteria bacterium]|nr:DUF5652 family protein [Candidatus Paceibacterota bacterium]MCF7862445.1 DUF5652 family protein [Candidatus Paceibacterota bacterium]